MDVIRIPKGGAVAHLRLTKAWNGDIQSVFMIQGAMSSFAETGEYQSIRLAEEAAILLAEQRSAAILIIEDRN